MLIKLRKCTKRKYNIQFEIVMNYASTIHAYYVNKTKPCD